MRKIKYISSIIYNENKIIEFDNKFDVIDIFVRMCVL